MGPTNVSLVRFYQADQAYRAALAKLEAATKNVRLQEGKVRQLTAEYDAAHHKALELEAKARELELDMRGREQRIEMLRQRQQNAQNNKEYQTFIIDINTQKVDKGKVEEQALAAMDTAAKQKAVAAELKTRLESETTKHGQMKAQIDAQVVTLTADADALKGPRDEAAAGLPPRTLELYRRAADQYEGEAMAPLQKPRPKVEEYICAGCNMDLVVDVYNRLHSRDELMPCPVCGRLLYIPEDLPPEKAISKKKPVAKPRKPKEPKSKLSNLPGSGAVVLPPVGDQTLRGERVMNIDEPDPSDAPDAPEELDVPAEPAEPAQPHEPALASGSADAAPEAPDPDEPSRA